MSPAEAVFARWVHGLAALTVAANAGVCAAQTQIGTATFTWEAFVDGQWRGGNVQTTATDVPVRARVSWSQDAGYAFASTTFDATISAPMAGIDGVITLSRPQPFNANTQTLVASRFGSQIKLDDSRDTAPPGLGARGVSAGQGVEVFGFPFSDANPAVILEFTLRLDAILGLRTVEALPIAPTNGNATDRWIRIYTNRNGAQNLPLVEQQRLQIQVIPAPAAPALATAAAMLALRRRRPN